MSTTTTIQLDPPITVDTPRGKAEIYFKTEYGPDSYTVFGCFLRDSGDFWEFRAPHVKLFWNETMATGRRPGSGPISESTQTTDSVKPDLGKHSGPVTGGILATVDWDSAQPGKINVQPSVSETVSSKSMCRITHQPCPTPLSCSIYCQVVERSQRAQQTTTTPESWQTGKAQQELHAAHEAMTKGELGRYMHLPQNADSTLVACKSLPGTLCTKPNRCYAHNTCDLSPQWICCSVCTSPTVCTVGKKCAKPLPDPEPKPLAVFASCKGCKTPTGCTVNGFCRNEVRV